MDIKSDKEEETNWNVVHTADLAASATPQSFFDAVRIWCNKPHVANRRLVGTEELWRIETVLRNKDALVPLLLKTIFQYIDSTVDTNSLSNFIKRTLTECSCDNQSCVYCKIKVVPEYNSDSFNVSPAAKKCKIFDKSSSICLRVLLPKLSNVFGRIVEIVILVEESRCVMFIPVASVLNDNLTATYKCDALGGVHDVAEPIYRIEFCERQLEKQPARASLHVYGGVENLSDGPCGCSIEWLRGVLMGKLVSWSRETTLNTSVTSLTQISVQRYSEVYAQLKEKYGKKLVKMWTESTDPKKFVYEDIGIASYLIVLWEEETKQKNLMSKQSFVDLGCGNGLLVYLLNSEGYPGEGLDVRKRQIWDVLGSVATLKGLYQLATNKHGVNLSSIASEFNPIWTVGTKKIQCIQGECTITPSDSSLFPDCDWLIGNHSDELTPWIPVIAARSSYRCRYFLLPCCPWDFDDKFSTRTQGISVYQTYLEFVREVGEKCGFIVNRDILRIPSTKRTCFIGASRCYAEEERQEAEIRIQSYISTRSTNQNKKISVSGHYESSEHESAKDTVEGSWIEGFKARTSEESRKNSSHVERSVRDFVTMTTYKHLLETEICPVIRHDGTEWNKGGSVSLVELSRLFESDTLKKLKSECGGLQTLLKNCPDVFKISDGCVLLRDWTSEDYADYVKTRRSRAKGQGNGPGQGQGQGAPRVKTRLCFHHMNHPQGCPLPTRDCRFAHGEADLRTQETDSKLNLKS